MELVKRLEGSEPEEINYDFEEHYLHEDEETSKRKKGTFFTIFGLIFIAILGYFGFKNFNTNEIKPIDKSLIVTNLSSENISETTKTEIASMPVTKQKPKEIEKKVLVQAKNIEVSTIQEVIKEEPPKILTYTEVLAQEIQPVVTKVVAVKTTPIKEKVKVSIPQEIVKEVIKESPPKKKVVKHITIKKPTVKMALNKSRIAIVKKGDTLALISKKYYGTREEFNRIVQANKSIKSHRSSLKIGQKIFIPSLKAHRQLKISSKKTRVITVKKGDTLNVIAQRFYGSAKEYKRIIRANKKIRSSKTRLKLGQKVIVPYMPKNKRRRFVTVKKGYSLAYISKKFYGNTSEVKKIVSANYNIKSAKSTLRIGQKVYVPR